jgi:hypothetical protein
MADSTALVPIPFYAPVRTGTTTLFKFSESSGRPVPLSQPMRTVAPEPDDALIYSGSGRLVADSWIGTRLNIYA